MPGPHDWSTYVEYWTGRLQKKVVEPSPPAEEEGGGCGLRSGGRAERAGGGIVAGDRPFYLVVGNGINRVRQFG